MKYLILLIWWFAVVSASGENVTYFEYVKRSSCDIIQSSYDRVLPKVTKCLWKETHDNGRSSL